jgi:exodeoxyribonuclease-5
LLALSLKNNIYASVAKNLGYEFTASQDYATQLIGEFVENRQTNQVFLLKGYAGTGKTTLVAALVKALAAHGIKVVLLAPTGRAAKVLSSYSHYPAFTIHKWIYRQKSSREGVGSFALDRNMAKDCLFIVDEASMLSNSSFEESVFGSGQLLNDLLEYIQNGDNCKLMLVGDEAQLPPVKLNVSPALNKRELSFLGYNVTEVILSEVLRQSSESGILFNATAVRTLLDSKKYIIPSFRTLGFNDFKSITGEDVVETIENCYGRDGVEETVIINYSNKRANLYNQGIRNRILWHETEIASGDLLMVARNNYFWSESINDIPFIANGDTFEVVKIIGYKDLYGFRFAEAIIRLIDYQQQELEVILMLDTLTVEGPSLPADKQKMLYESIMEDYEHIKTKQAKMKKLKADPYFNALQVKFAYAITCHKAQGGQWKNVFIDQGFVNTESVTPDYLRWLYTAITRATDRVYLVNFPSQFFS